MQIAVVDDSPTNLAVLKSIAAKMNDGDAIGFAKSPEAANYLKTNQAMLIVVDYSMPHLNGVDFVRGLRREGVNRDTPIIMVTHSIDDDIRVEAVEAGVTDFLRKPVDAISFKAILQQHLDERKGVCTAQR